MAYDEDQASRLRYALRGDDGVEEIKMFGGLCFMLKGHMLGGVGFGGLIFRVGKENMAAALARPGASTMDMRHGVTMGGMVKVDPGSCDDARLDEWVAMARKNALARPPKAKRAKKKPVAKRVG
jgi:TfoX/Sxy family transcriptional regulator of competence genes